MTAGGRFIRGLAGGLDQAALRRWSKAAEEAESLELEDLKELRSRARALRRRVDRTLHVAEGRLARPRNAASTIRKPIYSDWAYRPEIWNGPLPVPGIADVQSRTVLGSEGTIYHDSGLCEMSFRQFRNTRQSDLAPYGLRAEIFGFDGSFLSLVIDLPSAAVEGLKKRHLVRLDMVIETERPVEVFARLNVRHGPNTEQIVREIPMQDEERWVEFDLGYSDLNEKRIERMWLDLIFERPEMNRIDLRDMTLSRRPRAEI